jgi:GntR family transcriptional regulator/MocR family aminotransferase
MGAPLSTNPLGPSATLIELHVRLEGRRDLARQLHRQVRLAILSGRLRPGDRLPATRELAVRLGVARNTVGLAYEWLGAEGLISARRGAGSFVTGSALPATRRRALAPIPSRAFWEGVSPQLATAAAAPYDFVVGVPDAELFPFDAWRRCVARQIRRSARRAEQGDPAGLPALREALARHLALSRGVNARPDDIFVTTGARGAFDLIARVLLDPGGQVAVEDPGYPPPRLLFESCGARVAPVRCDGAGLDVQALPENARLVYTTPSHQFPLGVAMSHVRRIALLQWAERHDAVIVEDDYDSEFRFGGRPLETLHALDRSGRVIYVGTFSKSLLPSLRLGFLVAPESLRPALFAASYAAGSYPEAPAQGALSAFIETGLLARHLRRMRRAYAARHERILRVLERDFADWIELWPSLTGMHVAGTLRRGGVRLEAALARCALAKGVRFDRLSWYSAARPRAAGVVIGYGAIREARIDEGLRRLRACCETWTTSSR